MQWESSAANCPVKSCVWLMLMSKYFWSWLYIYHIQLTPLWPVWGRSSFLLFQSELLIQRSMLELECENNATQIHFNLLTDNLFNFHWNVTRGLNKSIRLKETYLSCSFNSILDGLTVQQGVITWIDGPETHSEGLMWFHLISLLWISVQRAKWCAGRSPKSSFKWAEFRAPCLASMTDH